MVFLNHYFFLGSSTEAQHLKSFFGILGNSTFFFISGYLIYLNNDKILSLGDIKKFYVKRFWRIYPLYWVAIIVFLISLLILNSLDSINISDLILTVLGLQMVFYPKYVSNLLLWFIGIIVVYYLIYPFLLYLQPKNSYWLFFYAILAILPLIVLKIVFGLFGGGIFEYYFIFIIGILAARSKFIETRINSKYWLPSTILFIVFLFLGLFNYHDIGSIEKMSYLSVNTVFSIGNIILLRYLLVFSFLLFIITVFTCFVPKTQRIVTVISIGAIGSYALYLFHMLPSPFIKIGAAETPILYNFIIICILLPLLVVICYYIQILSDKLLRKSW